MAHILKSGNNILRNFSMRGTLRLWNLMSLSSGDQIDGMAFSSSTNKIFVTAPRNNKVLILSINNLSAAPIVLYTGYNFSEPRDVDIDESTGKVYIANRGSSTITVLNLSDYSVITTISGLGISNPFSLCISKLFDKIYVGNGFSASVTVIPLSNPTSNTLLTGNGFDNIRGMRVDEKNDKVYVTNEVNNTISIFKASDPTVYLPAITTSQGLFAAPRKCALDYANDRLYVSNQNNNDWISVLKLSDLYGTGAYKINKTVGSFSYPYGIIITGGRMFVSNAANNKLSILSSFNIKKG